MKHDKKDLKKIIFGRTLFLVFLLLLQLVSVYITTIFIGNYAPIFYIVERFVSAIIVIYIINKDIITEFKITWILLIMIMPLFGSIFYIYTHLEIGHRKQAKDYKKVHYEYTRPLYINKEAIADLYKSSPSTYNLSHYIYNNSSYPIYNNTKLDYFSSGEEAFSKMIDSINKAEKFIFLEFFIIEDGIMWKTIRDILIRKARYGVEVRIMCDGMNVLTKIPSEILKELEAYGIKINIFSPLKPIVSTVSDHRDHRKICIIDGVIAYTGGFNIADEYINKKKRFGYWKDCGISIVGQGVDSLTSMFLEMWNISNKKIDNIEKYITDKQTTSMSHGNGYVIPFGDSPLDKRYISMSVLVHMFNNAKRYINIMTPYLILNGDVIESLKNASRRGVEVCIIMPGIPDKKYAFYLAKTYYNELIGSGVKIYEFTPGFIHSKVVLVDDECGMVGTVNLDYRSLFHHFECGVYLFRNMELLQIKADFENTIKRSRIITISANNSRPLYIKLTGYLLKVIAPLM